MLHAWAKKQFHILGAIFCQLLRKTYVRTRVSYHPPPAFSCSVRLRVASQGCTRSTAQNVRGRQERRRSGCRKPLRREGEYREGPRQLFPSLERAFQRHPCPWGRGRREYIAHRVSLMFPLSFFRPRTPLVSALLVVTIRNATQRYLMFPNGRRIFLCFQISNMYRSSGHSKKLFSPHMSRPTRG